MPSSFVLSALGRDRPGIVAAVTRVLYELGCNIEDSSMTLLGGNFAMLLIVQAPEGRSARDLLDGLDPVARELGLTIHADPVAADRGAAASEGAPYVISVYGADHLGIVWSVADRLAKLGVNITDVSTRLVPGATPLYVMLLEVTAPPGLEAGRLQQEMAALAAEVACDITVKPLDVMRL
jgi:glycine cleavage system transcriptional repressor